MLSDPTLSLTDRLQLCAALWSEATGKSLGQLGREAVSDHRFFDGIESSRRGPTTATLEKFARFLTDAGNWPEGQDVPAEVVAFGHVVGVSADGAAVSPGKAGESSPSAQVAA